MKTKKFSDYLADHLTQREIDDVEREAIEELRAMYKQTERGRNKIHLATHPVRTKTKDGKPLYLERAEAHRNHKHNLPSFKDMPDPMGTSDVIALGLAPCRASIRNMQEKGTFPLPCSRTGRGMEKKYRKSDILHYFPILKYDK